MKVNLLKETFDKLDLPLDDEKVTQFLNYESLLVEWNQHMNLTGITDSEGIYDKHFADSLMCLKSDKIFEGAKIIDVGTGAGFPGMPLKIFRPDVHMTLLDSLNKRINFLKAVSDKNEMSDITFIHGRAEDFGQDPEYREQYDVVVSRAVAELPVLLEYCTPFLKIGGYFIAQKGKKCEDELKGAENALAVLNLKVEKVMAVETSQATKDHHLIIIKKIDSTNEKYPRRAGKPIKKPL